ncbi:MAG: acyltransferase [Chitinispirillaceae bacterium]
MTNNRRLLWADLLKIVSIMGVITIHSAAPLLVSYDRAGAQFWWAGNIYNSLSRWCIPVFFMISGAFLIPKANGSLSHFFKRRLQRILLPFLLWSFVYFLWRIHINGEDLLFSDFFSLLIEGPIYYHLWFFYVLIVLYLFAPVLGTYFLAARGINPLYFFLLWFLSASILPLLQEYFDLNFYFSNGSAYSPYYYLGYFFLGFLLRDITLSAKETLLHLFFFFTGLFLTALGTYDLTIVQGDGQFEPYFFNYYSPNVFLMAFSIYLLIKSIPFQNSGKAGIISWAASCVPGIFLVHAIVIAVYKQGMLGFTLSETMYRPAVGIPLFSLAVFGASLFIVTVIKLIPGLKHTVP